MLRKPNIVLLGRVLGLGLTHGTNTTFTDPRPQDYIEATPKVQGGSSPEHPIAPGIFKANYGDTIEYISLSYQEQLGDVSFVGTKITADKALPAGKITFKGKLSEALVMGSDEQVGIQ